MSHFQINAEASGALCGRLYAQGRADCERMHPANAPRYRVCRQRVRQADRVCRRRIPARWGRGD